MTYAPSDEVAEAVTFAWNAIEGSAVSVMTTSEEVVAAFPESSVDVHTTVVVPSPKDDGEYVIVGVPSTRSVDVAATSVGVVVVPVASKF